MINLKHFDSNLLKIDKKHQIGKIDDCEKNYIVNPLYLLINHASGYTEEKNGNKYWIFNYSINENKSTTKKIRRFLGWT